jgi:RimJ/RimL family protein N-acetyltransferase
MRRCRGFRVRRQTGTLGSYMTFDVSLRPVTGLDVDEFFAHSEARCPGTPQDYERFSAHWRRQLVDPSVKVRTITVAGQVAGYIGQFTRSDLPEVSYELGPKFWGKGFATTALGQFVSGIDVRPLYARAAKDNARSIAVLRKCGFSTVGEGRFIAAGGHEVEELIFALGHS